MSIIYTQTSVVSAFMRFSGCDSAELRFALGSFAILPLTLWILLWIRQVRKDMKKSQELGFGSSDVPGQLWKISVRFNLNQCCSCARAFFLPQRSAQSNLL